MSTKRGFPLYILLALLSACKSPELATDPMLTKIGTNWPQASTTLPSNDDHASTCLPNALSCHQDLDRQPP